MARLAQQDGACHLLPCSRRLGARPTLPTPALLMRAACLQWHAPSRSLFASTDCDYIDRHGNDYDYGAMAGLRWPQCMHKPSDVPHP